MATGYTSISYAVPDELREVINSLPARQPNYEENGLFQKKKLTMLMFTVFAPNDGVGFVEKCPKKAPWCDELVFQLEECPTTRRQHWQCYAHSDRQVWGGQWLKHFQIGPGVTEYNGTLYWRNPQIPLNVARAKAYCEKLRTRVVAYKESLDLPMPMPMPTPPPVVATTRPTLPMPMPMPTDPFLEDVLVQTNPSWRQAKAIQKFSSGDDATYDVIHPCRDGRCSTTAYVTLPDGDVVCVNCVNEYMIFK